jgi:hypothetical protein
MSETTPWSGDLVVGTLRAARGTRATGHIAVDLGVATVEVPVVLIHGAAPGPRVAVTSGIHGAEYVSIAAHRRVAMELDPERMRGSLVSVLVANPAAFAARSIYVDPLDGRNLNRVFPGDPAGTASERLAWWIHENVMRGSDAFIDMHCGDMNEALVPFNGIEECGDPGIDGRARAMAAAYGLDYLVIGPLPGSTTTAATALGMPAVLGEVGGQGLWPAGDVDLHAAGLRRTLAVLGLRDGAGDPPAPPQRLLGSDIWLRAGAAGFWDPLVAVGDTVRAGDRVGQVQDAFGAPLEVVTASVGGVVLFLVTSLAMNAGDPLLALGA